MLRNIDYVVLPLTPHSLHVTVVFRLRETYNVVTILLALRLSRRQLLRLQAHSHHRLLP